MVRFALVLVALVGLWVPPAFAEQSRAFAKGLLWRVENTSGAASYVFGTVHVADPRVQAVVEQMLEIVGPVDSISLEIVQTPEMAAAVTKRMFSLQGPTLSQRVGGDLFARTVESAAPYGLSANILERFKPWAVAVTLSVPVSVVREQAAGHLNSEKMLEAHAARNRIALHGIETVDEQLRLFDDLSETEQVEMLRLAIQNNGNIDNLFARILNSYLAHDLNGVFRLMEEMAAGQEGKLQEFFESEMIEGRNRRMAERIQPRLTEGNALIAVGALHLPDEVGLLRLLEQRGYTITRMPAFGSAR